MIEAAVPGARTLDAFMTENPSCVTTPLETGAVHLSGVSGLDSNAKHDLFHLSDYAVSSSSAGPSYILTPRIAWPEEQRDDHQKKFIKPRAQGNHRSPFGPGA